MNWYQVKNQWPAVQAEIRCTWGRLDEDDLAMIRGDRDSLTRILAQRYGYEYSVAQQKVDAFIDRMPSMGRRQLGLRGFLGSYNDAWVNVAKRR